MGEILHDDGDGGTWRTTCGTCRGTGEVSEEWLEERARERAIGGIADSITRAYFEAKRKGDATGAAFCALGGERLGWLTTKYKCCACRCFLCAKHAEGLAAWGFARRTSFWSPYSYFCPYCRREDAKMELK
jgi:hypothetical protein